MYYCRGMKRPTKKNWIILHAFSSHLKKWMLQSTARRVCSASSCEYLSPTFLRSRLLNPTTTFVHHLTKSPFLPPWSKRDPWKPTSLCRSAEICQPHFTASHPTAQPRSLAVPTPRLPVRNCYEVGFAWLPPAGFLQALLCPYLLWSQLCTMFVAPLHAWHRLSLLGTQSKTKPPATSGWAFYLCY